MAIERANGVFLAGYSRLRFPAEMPAKPVPRKIPVPCDRGGAAPQPLGNLFASESLKHSQFHNRADLGVDVLKLG